MPRDAVHRSALAGWGEYGYCASHSHYFWGLRLHPLCTLHGLPVGFAVSDAKADEREVLPVILDADSTLRPAGPFVSSDPLSRTGVHALGLEPFFAATATEDTPRTPTTPMSAFCPTSLPAVLRCCASRNASRHAVALSASRVDSMPSGA